MQSTFPVNLVIEDASRATSLLFCLGLTGSSVFCALKAGVLNSDALFIATYFPQLFMSPVLQREANVT